MSRKTADVESRNTTLRLATTTTLASGVVAGKPHMLLTKRKTKQFVDAQTNKESKGRCVEATADLGHSQPAVACSHLKLEIVPLP